MNKSGKQRDPFDQGVSVVRVDEIRNDHQLTEEDVEYCESHFDSFLCWLAAPVGQVISQPCPPFSWIVLEGSNVTRKCQLDGNWSMSDYKPCFELLEASIKQNRDSVESEFGETVIYYIGYSITIVALIIALAIFGYFRSLRCLRNIIHCNLLCAFLLNSMVWLFLHSTVEKLYLYYPKVCTSIGIFANFINTIPFYWMFIEGLYLFTLIVLAVSEEKVRLSYCLLFGWGAPVIPSAVWAGVRLHRGHAKSCLLIPDIKYDIIRHGPIFLMLALNGFFIAAVIWVLVKKLRAVNTLEIRQSRKVAKALVALFPLLGVTYIFFINAPTQEKEVQWIFTQVRAVLLAFQGLCVAIIYCFLNGEVISVIRLKVKAFLNSRYPSRYSRGYFFGNPRRWSCYAMTTIGRNTVIPANATGATVRTAVSGSISELASSSEGSKRGFGEEATVMVVSRDLWTSSTMSNDERQQQSELQYSAEDETEQSETMRENML